MNTVLNDVKVDSFINIDLNVLDLSTSAGVFCINELEIPSAYSTLSREKVVSFEYGVGDRGHNFIKRFM